MAYSNPAQAAASGVGFSGGGVSSSSDSSSGGGGGSSSPSQPSGGYTITVFTSPVGGAQTHVMTDASGNVISSREVQGGGDSHSYQPQGLPQPLMVNIGGASFVSGSAEAKAAGENNPFVSGVPPSQGITQSQAITAAREQDQAQMAAAVGLGTTGAPATLAAAFITPSLQAFREQRQKEITESTKKGYFGDTQGAAQSPIYEQNLDNVSKKGGAVFIPTVGTLTFEKPPIVQETTPKAEIAPAFLTIPQEDKAWKGVPYEAIKPEMQTVRISPPALEMRGGKPFEGYIDFSEGATVVKSDLITSTALGMPQQTYTEKKGVVLSESRTTPSQVYLTPSGKFAEPIVSKQVVVGGQAGTSGEFVLSAPASQLPDKEERFTQVVRQASINQAYENQKDKLLSPEVQAVKEGFNVFQDIDTRWQSIVGEGKSIFFGEKPKDTLGAMAWGFGTVVLEGSAVEGTKLGLGFVQASRSFGTGLRYGEPSYSPFIGLTQSITGTRQALTMEETELYFKAGGAGAVSYVSFPTQLAIFGKVAGAISREAPILSASLSNTKLISPISSKIPFSIVPTLTAQPVLFGAVGFASGYALTKDVGAAAGAGLGTAITFRAFEKIGEGIIESRKQATDFKALGLVEQNFVQSKSYPTAKEAAQFYLRATPKEFAEASGVGAKAARAYNAEIPSFTATEAKGGKVLGQEYTLVGAATETSVMPAGSKGFEPIAKVNYDVRGMGKIEPTNIKKAGFSGEELKTEIFKLKGMNPQPMEVRYTGQVSTEINPATAWKGAPYKAPKFSGEFEIRRNIDYGKVLRLEELKGNFQPEKPSILGWAKEKIGETQSKISEGIQETTGFYVKTGVDIVSPKIEKAAKPILQSEKVASTVEIIEGAEASLLKGIHETKFKANVAYDKWANPKLADIYTQKGTTKQRVIPILETPRQLTFAPTQTQATAQVIAISGSQYSTQSLGLAQSPRLSNAMDLAMGTRQISKREVKQNIRQELTQETAQGLRTGLLQGLTQDITQNTRQELRMDLRQELVQDLAQNTRQEIRQGQRQELKQLIPEIPKIPLIGFPFALGDTGENKIGKRTKTKGKYQPSFTAIAFGIKGAKGKTEATGIAIRPLPTKEKKEKKSYLDKLGERFNKKK